jgi:hypothetical protein
MEMSILRQPVSRTKGAGARLGKWLAALHE